VYLVVNVTATDPFLFVVFTYNVLTLSPPIPLRLYTLPYWSNPAFLIFDIRTLWRSGLLCQSARVSKMKNGGLDQYDNEPLEQQQFGPADVEGVKAESMHQTNKTDILDSSCIRAITFKHTFTIMTKASFPFLAI